MQTKNDGKLIALEGIDGCGKSIQAARLRDRLESLGHSTVTLREPGDSEYGQQLRGIFAGSREVSPQEEVRLFLEDRRIDVRDNILPALAAGKIVIMDRYYLSSVVYQGCLGLDPGEIQAANEAIAPRPDLTLILDIDPTEAERRIHAARGGGDSFEGAEYQRRVRKAYLGYVDGQGIVRVDAARSPEQVCDEMLEYVLALLRR